MQVIHRYNGVYPFSLQQQTEQTYLEVLKENLTEQEIAKYRQKYKIIKGMDHTNLIQLVKIYKQQSTLHLLYEYISLSLEKYLERKSLNAKDSEKNEVKEIYCQFVASINRIIDIFAAFQIKTDILIQNFAVVEQETCHLKLFIDPDAEFIGRNLLSLSSQSSKVNNTAVKNKEFLIDFYEADKTRLAMQLQQLFQKYFGRNFTVTESNRPNFVINGSKLVFLNHSDPKKLIKQSHNNNLSEGRKDKEAIPAQMQRETHSNSPNKVEKAELKRDLKQKTKRKIQQIKNVLNRFQTRSPVTNSQPQYKIYPQNTDQIFFQPEEITNDKTALLEENQYLQSLESQLQKITQVNKKRSQRSGSEEKRAEMIKQINELQEKSRNGERSSQSTEGFLRSSDKREGKPNTYKMKITTSHQIEIEGADQPQVKVTERENIEGIKSGKINVSQLSQKQQRPKTVKVQPAQTHRLSEIRRQKINFDDNMKISSRNSDIASKSKKINEIIQKINSKASINSNHLSNSAHQNQHRSETNEFNPPYKSNIEAVEHHTDNYHDKIREAKHKAQQVLKEYAKKKQ